MQYLYEILMKDGNSWKFMEMTECIQNRGFYSYEVKEIFIEF